MKTVIGYPLETPGDYRCMAIEGFVPGDLIRAAMLTLALVSKDSMQDFEERIKNQFNDAHIFTETKEKIADRLPPDETHRVYLMESIPTDDGAEMLDWRAYDSNVMAHAGVSSSHWPSKSAGTNINHAAAMGVSLWIANDGDFWQLMINGHDITANDFYVAVEVAKTVVHFSNAKVYTNQTIELVNDWLDAISYQPE